MGVSLSQFFNHSSVPNKTRLGKLGDGIDLGVRRTVTCI